MRARVILFTSLAANLGLALGWLVFAHRGGRSAAMAEVAMSTNSAALIRTNVVYRRHFFTWSELESPDYAVFIGNLRAIECPEQTIRDIIIADVNALYARRRATEVLTPEQQWWRVAPDPEVLAAATAKLQKLDHERRVLLTSLLGPQWETGDQVSLPRPSRPGLNLDGPVLGALPTEVKQTLQEISSHSQERLQAYLEERQRAGLSPDAVELARMRQQTRDELARVLSPVQLEEFLLRFSQNASALRSELGQLQFFEVSPEEFRKLFRARDAYDQQLALLGDAADAASQFQRAQLEQQREKAMKAALGETRYAEYVQLHDAGYRGAYAQAQQAGAPEAAGALHEIGQVVAEEKERIQADVTLTEEQKKIELKRIELEQLKANVLALGQELPPEPPTPPVPTRAHSYERYESLMGLSLKYDVTVSSIVAANPNVDWNHLSPGQTIQIPAPKKR